MITWQTAKTLARLAIGFAMIWFVSWASNRTPCDSPFWEGYRIGMSIKVCR